MKKIPSFVFAGFIFGFMILAMQSCSDGFGISKVANYYDTYRGSMSYRYYKITFRPTGKASVQGLSVPILHYGYNLRKNAILKANILQSEIPEKDLKKIFYDTTRFTNLSPDSIYLGWISLRGNYLLFPFSDEYGFKLTDYTTYTGEDEEVLHYPTLPDWKKPMTLYAWASLLTPSFYLMAFISIFFMVDFQKLEAVIPLGFSILYAVPAYYVGWMDYSEEKEWPILILICSGILILVYLFFLYRWATGKLIKV
jgi:hypothetical protein